MTNYGNTGHRYKLPKIAGADVVDGKCVVHLECGHTYTLGEEWTGNNPQKWADWYKDRATKGKRERCNTCKGAQA